MSVDVGKWKAEGVILRWLSTSVWGPMAADWCESVFLIHFIDAILLTSESVSSVKVAVSCSFDRTGMAGKYRHNERTQICTKYKHIPTQHS